MFIYVYPKDSRFMPVDWDGTPQQALSSYDYEEASARHKVPISRLRALIAVEAAGSGFLLNEPAPARPKILFERHIFYRLTPLPVSKTRPDLSAKNWNKSAYKGGSAEWGRLEDAMKFDALNALKSASWGLGQVMGFNHKAAGCPTIQQLVEECFTGEAQQFNHMLRFIESGNMMDDLREGRWAQFARKYNGPSYAANQYDKKLAAAEKRFIHV